jgi:LCP family protein required for cell wall assembly
MPAAVPKRRRLRRTWPQRLVIGFNLVVVLSCLGAGLAMSLAYDTVRTIKRVSLGSDVLDPVQPVSSDDVTSETFGADGPLPAENWLITGSDSREKGNCGITNPQYAGAFGSEEGSERSDTIMVLRIDPDSNFTAILSFPRDLYVKIGSRQNRINTAFRRDDPSLLIKTIKTNFGVPINHYANIDFCGFKDLVDAVGGVRVPFSNYARDRKTGLNVAPGCVAFDGQMALAFVRSRHYQVSTDGKKYVEDPASDWSRIRRQQYLLKRIAMKLVTEGIRTSPRALNRLVKVGTTYIEVDSTVPIRDLQQLASKMRTIDPALVQTYTFEGTGIVVDGAAVISPSMGSRNNKAVVAIFTGKAYPADVKTADQIAAEQGTTSTVAGIDLSTPTTKPRKGSTTTTEAPVPTVTIDPTKGAGANAFLPDADPSCL